MTEQTHPYEIMAEFVNVYEAYIKPWIKKGEVPAGLMAIIMESHMRYEIMESLPIMPNGKALAHHRLALNFLVGLVKDPKASKEHVFNYARERIETNVEELDKLLSDDPHYKNSREEIK